MWGKTCADVQHSAGTNVLLVLPRASLLMAWPETVTLADCVQSAEHFLGLLVTNTYQ